VVSPSNRHHHAPGFYRMLHQTMGSRDLIQGNNLANIESAPTSFKCPLASATWPVPTYASKRSGIVCTIRRSMIEPNE
jgi:hypothetical protein